MKDEFGGTLIEGDVDEFGGVAVPESKPVNEESEYIDKLLSEEAPQDIEFRKAMAEKAAGSGFLDVAASGLGKGYMDIARGTEIADPAGDVERVYWQEMEREYPWLAKGSRMVGQALPFVPAYMAAAPAMAATGLVGKAALTGGIGAIEGAAIAKGTGGDVLGSAGAGGGFALGADVIAPHIGKLARKLFFKVRGTIPKGALLDATGKPTTELVNVLDDAGLDFEDLGGAAIEALKKQDPRAIPSQAAAEAIFKGEGVDPTRAAITKEATAEAREETLKQKMGESAAAPFRERRIKQSEQIKDSLYKAVTQEDLREFSTGEMVKDAINDRYKVVHDKAATLYDNFTSDVKEIAGEGITLNKNVISEAIPDDGTFKDLMAGSDTARRAIQDLDSALAEFNLKSPMRQFADEFNEPVEDLSITNFNRLRKRLNAIKKKDISGAASVAINPIIRNLDREAEQVASIMQKQGIVDRNIVDNLYAANDLWRQLNQEFTDKDLVGKLIKKSSDNITPSIEASNVYYELAKKGTPFEKVGKVVNTLRKSGNKGSIALQNLQDSTMLDLIEAGYSTQSRTIEGVPIFNPGAFRKRVDQLGKDKINIIFGGNRLALNKIKNIEYISKRLQPAAEATPKGSGIFVKELLGKSPVIGELLKYMRTKGEVRQALKPDVMLKQGSFLEEFTPNLSKALGVSSLVESRQQEEQTNEQ